MKSISHPIKLGVFAFGSTILVGCGATADPATETPVEVTAGMYHLSTNGQIGGFNMPQGDGPGKVNKDICVRAGEEAAFPTQVAAIFKLHQGCSFQPGERTGNAISGIYTCPTDSERAPGGNMTANYTGSVAADRVEVTGQITMNIPKRPNMTPEESAQLDQAQKMMSNIKMVVTAERTDDCNSATQTPAAAPTQASAPESAPDIAVPDTKFGEPTSSGKPTEFR